MPRRSEIVAFDDSPPPPGASPWVPGAVPATGIEIAGPDRDWPLVYAGLAARIREVLGWRALQLDHVGSTSVPGLPAKPIIDIDLTVADPAREPDYVPALEKIGFALTIREPWRYEHRCLRADEPPRCNLHVFGFDSPEPVRHRIFRDWLRGTPDDRDLYAAAKRQAAAAANTRGEHVMQYNARKGQVIREIYRRAFTAAGLLPELPGRVLWTSCPSRAHGGTRIATGRRATMPRFMDFHDDLKLPPEAIDQIAQGARAGESDEFGVRQIELFHNADGKVYCLLEGPDEDAIRKHHEALHVDCGDVHRVDGLF